MKADDPENGATAASVTEPWMEDDELAVVDVTFDEAALLEPQAASNRLAPRNVTNGTFLDLN
jgi:hypothetical protein